MKKTNKKESLDGEAVEALPKTGYKISMAWEVN
jgi:hypothetical protein